MSLVDVLSHYPRKSCIHVSIGVYMHLSNSTDHTCCTNNSINNNNPLMSSEVLHQEVSFRYILERDPSSIIYNSNFF